jgi:hypothetical protein
MVKKIFRHFIVGAMTLALASFISFSGCSKSPTEVEDSTIISGYDSLGVSKNDSPDTYYFRSGSTNYGSFQLWWLSDLVSPQLVQLRSNYGIKIGTGNVAPDSGYVNEITLDSSPLGQSFFLKTDNVPHYGKITIISRRDDTGSGYTFIGFQWIVQTVAGKRELY